ncbi:hypothetical protein KSD_60330 [Ktedonobacter sp. SOSP1-85]|uniref:cytochrome P450 n=1 Tax=Ktedonobacter sp. SOSP1-85 TaxID=2778367 RepID=UPI0019151E26|nr:cytochrome P450 [Ktedonobacter sp. SOSP1-85]GHO78262.1 hypothetical protein KSD_60330 [Ktedonobacter sp. SOSP1-85]
MDLDLRFTKDRRKLAESEEQRDETWGTFDLRTLLMVDPPDHTRLRHLVSKAFTPRMIEHQRPHIQQITDDLLDAIQAQGAMDLIADFVYPLPLTVISDLLGIPVADRQQFRAWTRAMVDLTTEKEQRTNVIQQFLLKTP